MHESMWNLGAMQAKCEWNPSEIDMVPFKLKENTHLWIAKINKVQKASRVNPCL
jgi:hypothetical protein